MSDRSVDLSSVSQSLRTVSEKFIILKSHSESSRISRIIESVNDPLEMAHIVARIRVKRT